MLTFLFLMVGLWLFVMFLAVIMKVAFNLVIILGAFLVIAFIIKLLLSLF